MNYTQLQLYGKNLDRDSEHFVHQGKLPLVLLNGRPLTFDVDYRVSDGHLALNYILDEDDVLTLVDFKSGNVATFIPDSCLTDEPEDDTIEEEPAPPIEEIIDPEPEARS